MSIVSFIIIITLPIHHLLQTERDILYDRRTFSFYLHDELLQEKNRTNDQLRKPFIISKNNKEIYIYFEKNGHYLKGCVTWTNAKKTDELQCYYSLEKQ